MSPDLAAGQRAASVEGPLCALDICAPRSRGGTVQNFQEFPGQRSVRGRTRCREARPTAHTTDISAFVRIMGRGTRLPYSRFSGCKRWKPYLAEVKGLTATLRQNHLE